MRQIQHVVLMGVSGCGKTEIGLMLADRIGYLFVEGDTYHTKENIEKMQRGEALTTEDRAPWLACLNDLLIAYESSAQPVVLACSSLKRDYRNILSYRLNCKPRFVYLKVGEAVIRKRFENREDHFMPEALIRSQFEALEEPVKNEALTINGEDAIEHIIMNIITDIV